MTYDPELIERLVREAREGASPVAYVGDAAAQLMRRVDLSRAMADQLEAARREVERAAYADVDSVRAIVKRAVLRVERVAVTAVRIEQLDQIINEAIDAYRAAKGNRP